MNVHIVKLFLRSVSVGQFNSAKGIGLSIALPETHATAAPEGAGSLLSVQFARITVSGGDGELAAATSQLSIRWLGEPCRLPKSVVQRR